MKEFIQFICIFIGISMLNLFMCYQMLSCENSIDCVSHNVVKVVFIVGEVYALLLAVILKIWKP